MIYSFKEIEEKWQNTWVRQGIFKAEAGRDKPKYYLLEMLEDLHIYPMLHLYHNLDNNNKVSLLDY